MYMDNVSNDMQPSNELRTEMCTRIVESIMFAYREGTLPEGDPILYMKFDNKGMWRLELPWMGILEIIEENEVANENFESAALIRDKIKELE